MGIIIPEGSNLGKVIPKKIKEITYPSAFKLGFEAVNRSDRSEQFELDNLERRGTLDRYGEGYGVSEGTDVDSSSSVS